MERQVQCKHFIEYFYLVSDSINETFLGHLLCIRHQVHHGKLIRMCCQHFADMTVFTLKLPCGQRETVTAFHKFELKFFDTVNEDLIERQWDFHRRIPCCQEPLGFSQR